MDIVLCLLAWEGTHLELLNQVSPTVTSLEWAWGLPVSVLSHLSGLLQGTGESCSTS